MCLVALTLHLYIRFIAGTFTMGKDQQGQAKHLHYDSIEDVQIITSGLTKNVLSAIEFNKNLQMVKPNDDCSIFCENMISQYEWKIYKNINLGEIEREKLKSIVVIILLKEMAFYKELFVKLNKFLDENYRSNCKLLHFYDDVIDRFDSESLNIESYANLTLEKAIEKHLYIEFIIHIVKECKKDTKHLEWFILNQTLIKRSMTRRLDDSRTKFIFHDILNDYSVTRITGREDAMLENLRLIVKSFVLNLADLS